MTDHEEHEETTPASATDPRSDAELDAVLDEISATP